MVEPAPFREYMKVQRTYDTTLRGVLERAALDIQARVRKLGVGIGADVRRAQLVSTLNEIRNVQQQMWAQDILATTVRGQKAAALAAQKAAETMDAVLYTALPPNVAEVVRDGLGAAARAGIERDHARVPRELSARVYKDFALTSGQVEQAIRSGVISGLSAKELAQSVHHLISPTAPGGVSYSAMRLARTEINNSFHEQQIAKGQRPGVIAVKWNLSGSHGKPDLCNVYASQDVDGLGKGLYKPTSVPGKPHPLCLCFLSYKTMDPADFARALNTGEFDHLLDKQTVTRMDTMKADRPKAQSHEKCTHPRTPAGRAMCRKAGGPPTDEFGNGITTGVKHRVPAVPKPAVVVPKPAPKIPLLPKTNKFDYLIKQLTANGKSSSEIVTEIRRTSGFTISDDEARKLVSLHLSNSKSGVWVGQINRNVQPAMASKVKTAVAKSQALVGDNINRLKSVEMHIQGKDAGVDGSMKTAFACCQSGEVHLARDLEGRVGRLKFCETSGWFAETPGVHDEVVRTISHEIGHALTVGKLGGTQVKEFFELLEQSIGVTPQRYARTRPRNLFDAVNYENWLKVPRIKNEVTKHFGRYALHSPAELMAEVWAAYTNSPNPTRMVRIMGEKITEMIKEQPRWGSRPSRG